MQSSSRGYPLCDTLVGSVNAEGTAVRFSLRSLGQFQGTKYDSTDHTKIQRPHRLQLLFSFYRSSTQSLCLTILKTVLVFSILISLSQAQNYIPRPSPVIQGLSGPNVCGSGTNKYCCPGWSSPDGRFCSKPVCPKGCQNGGRCIGPNKCTCGYGFTGNRCQNDYRLGPCYSSFENGRCSGELVNVKCTKILCCATIGRAWGRKCEGCPAKITPCRQGYIPNVKEKVCEDVDECKAIPGLCVGGRCVNTRGSYRCICSAQQIKNPLTGACELTISPCDSDPLTCSPGQCHKTTNGFYCTCPDQYRVTANGRACIPKLQRKTCYTKFTNGKCSGGAQLEMELKDCCCSIGIGWGNKDFCYRCPIAPTNEYKALCETSLTPFVPGQTTLKPPPGLCESLSGICGTNGRCIDTPGYSFRCQCNKGFVQLPPPRSKCVDIDECLQPGYCVNGDCLNSEGGYTCICPKGFALVGDARKYCTDMNECQHNNMCPNGKCMNMEGTYKCMCNKGYKQSSNQQVCVDIDECGEMGYCQNGECINTDGSFICNCPPELKRSENGLACIDVNECEHSGMCPNGVCVNTKGGYRCLCSPGFIPDVSQKACIDLNECKPGVLRVTPCKNGHCVNTQGSFKCECPNGYKLDPSGTICLDTKLGYCYSNLANGECLSAANQLMTKSDCCCMVDDHMLKALGWGEQGSDCFICPPMGTPNYYEVCGSKQNTTFVAERNECAFSNICGPGGICEDTREGYKCICLDGWQSDTRNKYCLDIDECAQRGSQLCVNGRCHNTPGSFKCVCPSGYQYNYDLSNCEDIDECSESPESGIPYCVNGLCVNNIGSYECRCEPGYILDSSQRFCVENQEGKCWLFADNGRCELAIGREMLKSECCNTVGAAWGSPCQECPKKLPPTTDTSIANNITGPPRRCPKGFSHQGLVCANIDECEILGRDACRGGGICHDTEGSFTCECKPPLILDETKKNCFDPKPYQCYVKYITGKCSEPATKKLTRKECCCTKAGTAFGEQGICEPCPPGGSDQFRDLCEVLVPNGGTGGVGPGDLSGRSGGPSAQKTGALDECAVFPTFCRPYGVCHDLTDGYKCTCPSGFELTGDGKNCTDINECRLGMASPCGNGECLNTPGSFKCVCDKGYEPSNMMQMCMDIDECSLDSGLCAGGLCINNDGSYKCQCPEGHEMTLDGRSCKDIDECSASKGYCSNGFCENFKGGFQCMCNHGFIPNAQKTACLDINECSENNGGCKSRCINTPGSFQCSCEAGFMLMEDMQTCIDVDECQMNPDICNGGICTNLHGSYRCACPTGMNVSTDARHCMDINECSNSEDLCIFGQCVNTRGSYKCRCNYGYSTKRGQNYCSDDDECRLGTHRCDKNAYCRNTDGSYECHCNKGFHGSGHFCQDVNECLRDNGGCHQDADCINKNGTFQCKCSKGYFGDGHECFDIDECTSGLDYCENGICHNLAGTYRCECNMGYYPTDNQTSCGDINECTFPGICANANCRNTPGHYECECFPGFIKDPTGINCTDINECDRFENCVSGICLNKPGSYECRCDPGFMINAAGTACVDKRRGFCWMMQDNSNEICDILIQSDIAESTCCCTIGQGWSQTPDGCYPCPRNGTTEYNHLCAAGKGFTARQESEALQDVDECKAIENICKGGNCTNTFGSYFCTCPNGYQFDAHSLECIDINECDTRGVCGAGKCINLQGNYTCRCPPEFDLMRGMYGPNCMDTRKQVCYLGYDEDTAQCSLPVNGTVFLKKFCCCSIGKAWGDCDRCPDPVREPDEYIIVCGDTPDTGGQKGGGQGIGGKVGPGGRDGTTHGPGVTSGPRGKGTFVNPITGQIEDINECQLIPHLCHNGKCENVEGSFRCHCPKGYRVNDILNICEDIDECIERQECFGTGARCVNSAGSYECVCQNGYRLDPIKNTCVDVNECTERINPCRHGKCYNQQGSYHCVCDHGFKLAFDRKSCRDMNECLGSPGMCGNGTCVNMMGSYKCSCNPGFHLDPRNVCVDTDECHTQFGLCKNGRCQNLQGDYICACQPGFKVSLDGHECEDFNECEQPGAENLCGEHGSCRNTVGSYTCHCYGGYKPNDDGSTCVDIDECGADLVDSDYCIHGTCENTVGSYKCTCEDGYTLSMKGNKCMDTRRGTCFNEINGACHGERPNMNMTLSECCCTEGVGWKQTGSRLCELCPNNRTEFRQFGIMCPNGLGWVETVDGNMKDVNECETRTDICANGKCINTDGSFRCECPYGYREDTIRGKCVDINECEDRDIDCGNGTCINIHGSYDCNCFVGFQVTGSGRCEDINECTSFMNQCAFRCINIPGSFRCACPRGYKLAADGRQCVDVDECAEHRHNCKHECKNLIGTFMCVCPRGYKQVVGSSDCRDIDECKTLRHACEGGTCRNIPGSYICNCPPGYRQTHDKKACVEINIDHCFLSVDCKKSIENMGAPMIRSACCCGFGLAWGLQRCEQCPARNSQAWRRMCPKGIGKDGFGEDVNECDLMPAACQNGMCMNTEGSYRCMCNRGYKVGPSGSTCEDFDECSMEKTPCDQICMNSNGSYTCACRKGYTLAPDNHKCQDINECTMGHNSCKYGCKNLDGGFECICGSGYRGEGSDCTDINECEENPYVCSPGTCTNQHGGFICNCPRGYKASSDLHKCLDVNECQQTKGLCGDQYCINTPGSYYCNPVPVAPPRPIGPGVPGVPGGTLPGYPGVYPGVPGCQNACAFMCIPVGSSFNCGCPNGYEKIDEGHCVTVSDPFLGFPKGGPIPHVENRGGELPQGEGCYECPSDDRPNLVGNEDDRVTIDRTADRKRTTLRRNRRSADTQDKVGIDRLFAKWNAEMQQDSGYAIIHDDNRQMGDSEARAYAGQVPRANQKSLDISRPITMKISKQAAVSGIDIIRMVPSLRALQNNVDYSILDGNDDHIFEVHSKDGVSTVRFAKDISRSSRTNYDLVLACRPLHDSGEIINDHIKLQTVHMKLRVILQ